MRTLTGEVGVGWTLQACAAACILSIRTRRALSAAAGLHGVGVCTGETVGASKELPIRRKDLAVPLNARREATIKGIGNIDGVESSLTGAIVGV